MFVVDFNNIDESIKASRYDHLELFDKSDTVDTAYVKIYCNELDFIE